MSGLSVPLLDVLAVSADPEELVESGQLCMHNLLLKSIAQVNVRSWMEFLVVMQLSTCTYD